MRILGIETSCDETSAGIVEKDPTSPKLTLLSNVIATSLALHAKTGGIIPEVAAREQVKYILPVIEEAVMSGVGSDITKDIPDIDAIAVTYGPGLIGSLLVGVETARTLAYLWNKPLMPINHMMGHIYANWIVQPEIVFPALVLVVSGNHTDLLLLKNHNEYEHLGGTRDAAGDEFDKTARLLGLPYPGGPEIERRAKYGDKTYIRFPRPMDGSGDYDFSFSGLKTAVYREVIKEKELSEEKINTLCACIMDAISDILVKKTVKAAQEYQVNTIILSGGVAANQTLSDRFTNEIKKRELDVTFCVPPKNLCTDNGAMIAAAAFFTGSAKDIHTITANPELYYEQ
jgi:N6-L-threonylcarbamoyladenine synthase